MGVTGSIALNSQFSQGTTNVPGNNLVQLSNNQAVKFATTASGTAADQVDLKYSRTITLAAAPTALDLRSLTDVFGGAVAFARVKSVQIVNKSSTDGYTVTVGYSTTTSNAWVGFLSNPGTFVVGPSTASNAGFFAITSPNATGWPVSSSSKLLNLDPGANTVVVDIEITGCSA
jgi:hypothetical protein